MDYDYDKNDNIDSFYYSQLFDSNIIGSYKTGAVTDGRFTLQNWPTVSRTGYNPLSISTPPLDNTLKRYLNVEDIPLQYDTTQIANGIINRPKFADFTKWLEVGPHGIPHLLFGYQMKTMFSADDVVFFFPSL